MLVYLGNISKVITLAKLFHEKLTSFALILESFTKAKLSVTEQLMNVDSYIDVKTAATFR